MMTAFAPAPVPVKHPSSGGWFIRPATEGELAEIVVLERETETAPHWAWADYTPLLHAGETAVHPPAVRRCLLVAGDGRVVSGFAVGRVLGSAPDAEAELESVVVRRDLRRQGLGSALAKAIFDWSRHQGASTIRLEVRAGSAGAIRLYGGLGFVAMGRRPRYYHDPTDDAVLMHCALTPAAQSSAGHQPQPLLF